jgi:hypothetical protein
VTTGTIDALRTMLLTAPGSIAYVPTTNLSGTVTLTVAVNDRGNTPAPALSAQASNTIRMTGVNDAPTATIINGLTTPEETALNFVANSFVISDVDSLTNPIFLTLTVQTGTIGRLGTNPGVTTRASTTPQALALEGTIGDMRAMLALANQVRFTPTVNFSGTTQMAAIVNDRGFSPLAAPLQAVGVNSIRVTGVNDAPTVSVTGGLATFEETPLVLPPATAVISDVDAFTNPVFLTVTVTNGSIGRLVAAPGVTQRSSSSPSRLGLEGNLDNLTAMLQAANQLVYTPSVNFSGTAQITFRINDRGFSGVNNNTPLQTDASTSILVTGINDGPILDLNGPAAGFDFTTTFTEGQSNRPAVAATAAITEPERNLVQLVDVVLINRPDGAFESLSATPSGGVLATWDTPANTLRLAAPSPVVTTTMQTVLRSVVYNNSDQDPAAGTRRIEFTALDQFGTAGATRASTITVTPVNDLPVVISSLIMTVPTATVGVPVVTVVPVTALNTTDLDHPPTQVFYTLRSLPTFGTLLLNGAPLLACPATSSNRFSQDDINNGRVSFSHLSTSQATATVNLYLANNSNCTTPGTIPLEIRVRRP